MKTNGHRTEGTLRLYKKDAISMDTTQRTKSEMRKTVTKLTRPPLFLVHKKRPG